MNALEVEAREPVSERRAGLGSSEANARQALLPDAGGERYIFICRPTRSTA